MNEGVKEVEGDLESGEKVEVMKEDGREIERGMIEYDDDEERKVEGNKRDEISEIIGYDEREEMINRKDMVVREERDEKEE